MEIDYQQQTSTVSYNSPILNSTTPYIEIPTLDDPLLNIMSTEKIKKKILTRINIALELLDKEQNYLRHMCILILNFKRPMVQIQNKIGLTDHQIRIAFGNLEEIIPLHQELLQKLMNRFNDWNDQQTLGDIFLDWIRKVHEPYMNYANNYHDCLLVWDDIKNKPGVKNFLEMTYEKAIYPGHLDIDSYLIKPIQRITRDYTMLFERLINSTPKDHPDFKFLIKFSIEVKKITLNINESTRDPAELKYFTDQQETYSPRSSGGYIYKKGGSVRNWKYRYMKIELESKELVYYKSENRKDKKGSIPLLSVTNTKPVSYTDKSGSVRKNLFIIVTGDRTYFIQPHNQEQRLRWIEAIEYYSSLFGLQKKK